MKNNIRVEVKIYGPVGLKRREKEIKKDIRKHVIQVCEHWNGECKITHHKKVKK